MNFRGESAVLEDWMRAELKKRVLTGVLGSMLVGVLLLTSLGTQLAVSVVVYFMLNEFGSVVFRTQGFMLKQRFFVGLGVLLLVISLLGIFHEWTLFVAASLGWVVFVMLQSAQYEAFEEPLHEAMLGVFGLLYTVFLPLVLYKIYLVGVWWLVYLLAVVFAGDIGAYFGGSFLGKRLVCTISPKKTWEGVGVGLLSSVAVGLVCGHPFFGLMLGMAGQLGDLVESFLKRGLGVKDFGSFLPGHGGFCDRCDSVIFAAPVLYACIRGF